MAKNVKLKAKKRFLFRGNILDIDEVFSVSSDVVDEYLNNDLAVRAEEVTEGESAVNFKDLKVDELKTIASEKGIENYANMKKAELIAALEAQGGSNNE